MQELHIVHEEALQDDRDHDVLQQRDGGVERLAQRLAPLGTLTRP